MCVTGVIHVCPIQLDFWRVITCWVGRTPDFRWQRGCLSVYVGSGACASAGQPRTKLKMIWCRVAPPQLLFVGL